jgi:large subunit ribosomal protein L29
MKVSELRVLSSDELVQKEKAFKKELYAMNYQRKMGQVEKSAQFRTIKRNIARILTILKEREKDGAKS